MRAMVCETAVRVGVYVYTYVRARYACVHVYGAIRA